MSDAVAGLVVLRGLAAAGRTTVPDFVLQEANDYSVEPARALGDELRRRSALHRARIYPSVGRTPGEGHRIVYLDVAAREPEVFVFLEERTRR